MKRVNLIWLAGAVSALVWAFPGCSDTKEPPPGKSAVRQLTDRAADAAVQQTRTPTEKARSAAGQQERNGRRTADLMLNY